MPRPKTKDELLLLAKKNYDTLINRISSYSLEERDKDFPTGMLNRNIGDVLGHLHEWHNMMLHWYDEGMKGIKPDMPARGYTWKTLPDLNREIQKQYASKTYDEVFNLFSNSHNKVMNIINSHSNDELFEKKRYKWTGSTSLGAYLISSTSSHYDWAFKLIKKSLV